MRQVLVFSATPRKRGNSDIMADQVAAGARAAGAKVEKIRLHGLRIGPCNACDACQRSRDAACVQRDDMTPLYAKLRAADALVFASPIYFFTISSQLKLLLDRLYAIGGGGDWTALAGKQGAALLTYEEANPMHSGVINAYGMFRDAFEFLGIEFTACLHAACRDAGEIRENRAALKACKALGRQLARPKP